MLLALLPERFLFAAVEPVVSLRFTTGYKLSSLRLVSRAEFLACGRPNGPWVLEHNHSHPWQGRLISERWGVHFRGAHVRWESPRAVAPVWYVCGPLTLTETGVLLISAGTRTRPAYSR